MTDSALGIMARLNANDYYRRAVECPEYLEAVQLREKALNTQQALSGVQSPPMPGADNDMAAWLDAVVAAGDARRIDAAKRDALTALIVDCNKTIESAVIADRDRLLRSLGHDMDEIMRDVAETVGAARRGENTARGHRRRRRRRVQQTRVPA